MDAPTMQIAGLRLAPVQCTAWGHRLRLVYPRLITIYQLMEPENAQTHYSEKLILLPNGVSPKPPVGQLTKTRSDFQHGGRHYLFFCCQALLNTCRNMILYLLKLLMCASISICVYSC